MLLAAWPRRGATAAVGVFVMGGSRDESPEQAGAAHALEHMLFKGTARRDARAIAEAIDQLGGGVDAWTSRERIALHAHVPWPDWQAALALLEELAYAPSFPAQEWAREREVIFAEMAMVADDFSEWAHDAHMQMSFPDAFGAPILGREATLARLSSEDLAAFHAQMFTAPNVLIAAVGPELAALEAALSADAPSSGSPRAHEAPAFAPGVHTAPRRVQQVAILLTILLPVRPWREELVDAVLGAALGGGASAWLFRRIREERGLAYSVHAQWTRWDAAAAAEIEVFTEAEKARPCAEALREALATLPEALDEATVRLAKRQIEVGIWMAMERPMRLLDRLADAFVAEIPAPGAVLGALRAIEPQAVRARAEAWLEAPRAITVAGHPRGVREAARVLARL